MKSFAELEAIRLKTLDKVNLRREHEGTVHVVIGMGTIGIAAGAKAITLAFMDEANKNDLLNMTITQSANIGQNDMAPVVEVTLPGAEAVTYNKVTPEMVSRIVAEHVIGGKPVVE